MKHLKGLDSLRALAAFVVVFDHIEIIKKTNGLDNLLDSNFLIYPDGHLSVMLFFIISGFLITYLLCVEKEKSGIISIKKFYIRRILRIWPLYYFILIISYLLFSPHYSFLQMALPAFVLPNVAYALDLVWNVSPQIWSIGVEEQFYIFWPFVFLFISKNRFVSSLILLIIAFTILPYFFKLINYLFLHSENVYNLISRFFYGSKFNSLFMGVLSGYIYFRNRECVFSEKYKWLKLAVTFIPFILWLFKFSFNHLNDEFYSVLFSFSVYQIVANPKIKLDNTITSFLGKISYGIYLYHWIVILLLIKYIPKFGNESIYNISLYTSVLGITIVVSWLSYNTFEKYFLNIKKRFEVKG